MPTLQLADTIGAPAASVEAEHKWTIGHKAGQRAKAPAIIGQCDFGKAIADAWRARADFQHAEPRHEFIVTLAPLGRGAAEIIQFL